MCFEYLVWRGRSNLAVLLAVGAAAIASTAPAAAAPITFNTFVTAGDISAIEGYSSTIAFNYAGNKFVGSVYLGGSNLQLFSTDLAGHNVQKFGSSIGNGFSGEVVVGASLGLGGFPTGDIYAGAGSQIYHFTNDGSSQSLFVSTPDGSTVRQIFFDPGSSFGGKMLVTTSSGNIYKIDSAKNISLLASVGEDTEGLDVATSAWGIHAGSLLVASEGSGQLRLVSPGGVVTPIGISLGLAETVSFVPLNLGSSGNSLEGFYVANYPLDIQKADASQFNLYKGDAIVTQEFGSNSPISAIHFDGTNFSVTLIGNLPNQSEDGIFVTAQRINDVNPGVVPEPSTIALLLTGGALVGFRLRRKRAA